MRLRPRGLEGWWVVRHRASGTTALLVTAAALAGCQGLSYADFPDQGYEFPLEFNGVRIRKPVQTFRDRRYRNVVPQRLDFSCGAAALATLLGYYYDDPVAETDIIAEMLGAGDVERIREEGFSLLDMKHYAERRGYQTRGYRVGPGVIERLAIPAITMVDSRGYNHFVVLKGAEDGRVYLADPALGQRSLPKSEFLEDWSGVVFFVAARRDGVELAPLELLEENPAPQDMVRWLNDQGLRNLSFDPQEF